MKTIALTFGRFNPPTIGHVQLIRHLSDQKADVHRIYLSNSHDAKKNPLTRAQRVKYLELFLEGSSSLVSSDTWANNPLMALVQASQEGFRRAIYVCGGDRTEEMQNKFEQYNRVQLSYGAYDFDEIRVVNAGDRIRGAGGVPGVSATMMRQAVKDDDFTTFLWNMPLHMADYAEELYDDVRKGMAFV